MAGVESFVFPIVPLQGTITVIGITWAHLAFLDMTFYFFHQPDQRNVQQGKR